MSLGRGDRRRRGTRRPARTGAGWRFLGGEGRPAEPAVWMRRLPERGMLPAVLNRQAVGSQLIRRIARQLAELHAAAATGGGIDEYGSFATVRANWDENLAQTAGFVGRTIPASLHARIRSFVARFLAKHGELLERRVAERRIPEGHGDLHVATGYLAGIAGSILGPEGGR